MHSPLARMARRTGRAAQRMLSQVIVSVAAAISVAIITNAYLDERAADAAGEAGETHRTGVEQPSMQPYANAVLVSGLPPLETVTILDRPIQGSTPSSAEIFPGVAADSPLAKAVAAARESEEPREHRFFGLRLPYLGSAEG